MSLEEIKKVAKKFQKINKQLKLHIVGSIARKEENPHDIDFVTNLDLPNEKKVYHTKFEGYKVDIWQYPNIKIGKFIRTVDKGHLIGLYKGLKKNGYKLTNEGILDLKTILDTITVYTSKQHLQNDGGVYGRIQRGIQDD